LDGANSELKGVKGWLLLLCLLLTVLEPFETVVVVFGGSDIMASLPKVSPQMYWFSIVNGIVGIGLAVFSLYAGLSLWKVTIGAVDVARAYLVLSAGASVGLLGAAVLFGITKEFSEATMQFNLTGVGVTVLYAYSWLLYLSRSRRVRNTYAERKDAEVQA
jgi:hypothetical protein